MLHIYITVADDDVNIHSCQADLLSLFLNQSFPDTQQIAHNLPIHPPKVLRICRYIQCTQSINLKLDSTYSNELIPQPIDTVG